MFEFESVSLDDAMKEFASLNSAKIILSKTFQLFV